MGLLDNFERGLERVVNGAFAKTFRSGLAPVEITSALRRELDTKAVIVSRDRILAPNRFIVRLANSDYQRMTAIGTALTDELSALVRSHATAQGYQFAGALEIRFSDDASLTVGMLRVDSETAKGEVSWIPVLEISGSRHPIVRGRTVIGRGSDADITVDDSSISRKHVEVLWDGKRAEVRDLGSTNGSQLDGKAVSRAILAPDSVISIGRTRIQFRVVAQAGTPHPSDHPGNPSDRERGTTR